MRPSDSLSQCREGEPDTPGRGSGEGGTAADEGERRNDHDVLPPVEPLVAYRPVHDHDVLGPIHVCRSCRTAMLASESEFVRCLAASPNFTHDLRCNDLAFTPWEAYQAVSRSPVCISEWLPHARCLGLGPHASNATQPVYRTFAV